MSDLSIVLIMSGVSLILFLAGRLIRPITKAVGLLCLFWLAATLPILFFLDVDPRHVLLFYLLSAAIGLISHYGGRKA